MKIYAPVKDANGIYASVRFVNGVGETNDPHLIKWFKVHGYTVEDEPQLVEIDHIPDTTKMVEEPEMMGYPEKEKSFEEMTPNELREYMIANGFNVRNTRNKEKLLEILRG